MMHLYHRMRATSCTSKSEEQKTGYTLVSKNVQWLSKEIVIYVVHALTLLLSPCPLGVDPYPTQAVFAILVRCNLLKAGTIHTTTTRSTPADSARMI